mgnify:CR=1 FL=1
MIYDVATPEEYLDVLEDDWRKPSLLAIRELLLSHSELEEYIYYKMLAYGKTGEEPAFCLNAQKGYVSLYVGNTKKIDPAGEWLAGLNLGKGCIRFSKTKKISDTQIHLFIAKAVELWRQGKDIGC